MKSPAQLAEQKRLDDEIMYYIRESQRLAPVTLDAVHNYLTRIRHFSLSEELAADRLDYLVGRDCLAAEEQWQEGVGQVKHYTITAKGRDIMDGVLPPDA